MGAAAGDYDNDGHEDLYVTAYGGNKLYHNNGDGTFTDVTAKAGVGGMGGPPLPPGSISMETDIWIWLYCVTSSGIGMTAGAASIAKDTADICHPDVFSPIPMLVYHNNGNGTFTEEAQKLGLDKPPRLLALRSAISITTAIRTSSSPMTPWSSFSSITKEMEPLKRSGYRQTAVDSEGRTYAPAWVWMPPTITTTACPTSSSMIWPTRSTPSIRIRETGSLLTPLTLRGGPHDPAAFRLGGSLS